VFENSVRCIRWGARILVIGFTGASALPHQSPADQGPACSARAGEAVRKNPALGEVRIKDLLIGPKPAGFAPTSRTVCAGDYAQAMRLLIDRKSHRRVR